MTRIDMPIKKTRNNNAIFFLGFIFLLHLVN
jgi:hypothetical protein